MPQFEQDMSKFLFVVNGHSDLHITQKTPIVFQWFEGVVDLLVLRPSRSLRT